MRSLAFPRFASEADEIRWWENQMDAVEENLAEAIQEGTARRGTTVAILNGARKALSGVFRSVTIRILEDDLDLARQQAEERGQSHQHYIAGVLHDALAKRRKR